MKKFLTALLLFSTLTSFVHAQTTDPTSTINQFDITQIRNTLQEKLCNICTALSCAVGDERIWLEDSKKSIEDAIGELNKVEDVCGQLDVLRGAKEQIVQKLQEWKEHLSKIQAKTVVYILGGFTIAALCVYFAIKLYNMRKDVKTQKTEFEARMAEKNDLIQKLHQNIANEFQPTITALQQQLAARGITQTDLNDQLARTTVKCMNLQEQLRTLNRELPNRGSEGGAILAHLQRQLRIAQRKVRGLTTQNTNLSNKVDTKRSKKRLTKVQLGNIQRIINLLVLKNNAFDRISTGRSGLSERRRWRSEMRDLITRASKIVST